MTLLERWDKDSHAAGSYHYDDIRRALAIAQAVKEMSSEESDWTVRQALRRADELLRGEGKP